MGATGIHLERGQKMADAVFESFGTDYEALRHVTKRTSGEWQYALYAAVRNVKTAEVFGLVVLMHRNPSPSVHFNFTYKLVDESMGPFESDAPIAILDLLSPTESPFAIEWRARCRANATAPKEPALKRGVTVEFDPPLLFSDKQEAKRFEFISRNLFQREDGRFVKINQWRARGGKVVAA